MSGGLCCAKILSDGNRWQPSSRTIESELKAIITVQ